MLRKCGSLVLAVAIFMSASGSAFAAGKTDEQQQPKQQQYVLAPGPAAGVHQAQLFSKRDLIFWLIGLGIVAGGLAVILSNNHNSKPATTTTGPAP